jgi:hypothetical protein
MISADISRVLHAAAAAAIDSNESNRVIEDESFDANKERV